MSMTPDLLLEVDNVALTEAILYCDFALHYNADEYIISDGFIKKQATPELSNYYPAETLDFILKNTTDSNTSKSYLKKITIKNVTKSTLYKDGKPTSVLECIFGEKPTDGWSYETRDNKEEVLVCDIDMTSESNTCKIKINDTINFYGLSDYYLSYTVQYFFIIKDEEETNTCVFDPLIKITNGTRKK
jgi:hypothetical protein